MAVVTSAGSKRIITAIKIALKSITGREIADNTITGGADGNLAAGTISAVNIEAGAITANEIAAETITGDKIHSDTITAVNILTLNMIGKTAIFDEGTIGGFNLGATELVGPSGAVIRSEGMTDFGVGSGFWLGNVDNTGKYYFGTQAGDFTSFDGTNIRVTGNLEATSVLNTYTYTVSNLPQPPTTVGFNSPAGNE